MKYKLSEEQCHLVIHKASTGLAQYCMDYGINVVVLGVSGGLDSAVVLALANRAKKICGDRKHKLTVVAITMPCESNPVAYSRAMKVIGKCGANHLHIDLTEMYKQIIPQIEWVMDFCANIRESLEIYTEPGGMEKIRKITLGNIKARMRMTFGTYFVANLLGGIVLSTDNYSELMAGFWTLHGDVGDFGMIQQVLKGIELYDIARCLPEIDTEIIEAQPDDGLGVTNGGDAAQLGGTYEDFVDPILVRLAELESRAGFKFDAHPGEWPGLSEANKQIRIPGYAAKFFEGHHEGPMFNFISRVLRASVKRRNPVNMTREELGLPPIQSIELE